MPSFPALTGPARRRARRAPRLLWSALLLALLALLPIGNLLAAPAHAEGGGELGVQGGPVQLVIATAGLGWEDVSAEATPALQCLADRSGLGAMNTSSSTVTSTFRQGQESLHTGYRGLAALAPRAAGIPDAEDQWEQLPVGTVRVDAHEDGRQQRPSRALSADDLAQLGQGLEDGDIVEVDLDGLPPRGEDGRDAALQSLDAQVGQVLDAAGGCDAGNLPRTLLVSVAATDPADPDAAENTGPMASRTAGLQVAMDSGSPGTALTSGATKQNGIVVLTDVLPTILSSHGAEASRLIPGQPIRGIEHSDPQQLAADRTLAAAHVDSSSVLALGSWAAPGVLGVLMLLIPPLARRPRLAAAARALATVAPLALPAGLFASLLPWWRGEHPTLALTGTVWAGAALLSVIVLAGPWRRSRFGPVGVMGALLAGLMLLESATGSRFQLSSPLGAQPISGGRFYGLSNHMFGLVLAGSLVALLCLFTRVRTPRARMLWTLGAGIVVAVVSVTPSLGADFGSVIVTVPTFGLLTLLVSGRRVRLWHVLGLGVAAAALVLGVSFLDWLRPAEERSHLGRFIDELLSGELVSVVVRKLAQNIGMSLDYAGLTVLLLIAIAASVAILMPGRLRLRRLQALDDAHPAARSVRIALVLGTWAGYAGNDTGPVLVAAIFGVWLAALPAVLPDPERGADTAAAPGTAPEGSTRSSAS